MSNLAPPGMMPLLPFEQQDRLSSKEFKVLNNGGSNYIKFNDCVAELYGQVFLFDKKQDLLKERLIRLRGRVSVIDDVILSLSVGEGVTNVVFHQRNNAYYVSFDCLDGVEYK